MSAVRNDKIKVGNSPNKLDDGPGQPSVVVSYKQQLSFGSFTWTGKLLDRAMATEIVNTDQCHISVMFDLLYNYKTYDNGV